MILFLFRSHIYRKHRDSQELRDQDMPSYYGDEPDDVNYNEITVHLNDITGIDMFSLFVHSESKYSIMFHA